MGHLKLTLLGPFEATLDGDPVRGLASSMPRALLAYLAVEGRSAPECVAHPREVLAALLWPEQPDREALARLRHTLFDLRRALGDDNLHQPFLLASRETIQFNPDADFDLDVTTFAQAVSAMPSPDALPLDPGALDRLEGAVALYAGGFLESLAVNSAPFEEWELLKREQLHWQAMGALRLLAAAYEGRGEYGQAERHARRQLELQPWQEEAHRQLMRALALEGQRSAALAQYQTCVQRLEAELGVAPADETVALYQAIRDGTLTRPEARPDSAVVALAITLLPVAPSLFVSREGELAKLDSFLERALGGQGQVAFVSGVAGSGKTALLAQFARQAMARYPNLVAAGGNCNAQAGSGDPYLPFREILQLLSGEIEAHRAGGGLSPEHARRLWVLLPVTARALMKLGPDLVGTLVPGEPLLRRIQAFAPDGTARWERLEALARREGGLPSQTDLFDQATQVLQAVAEQYPLLLLLDDLQWADQGTVSLLFHLGRRLGAGRILVVGVYRPATVALGTPSPGTSAAGGSWGRHPLEPVLHEFGRDWGDIGVDLDQADGRAFVEAFIDTEPNCLDVAFRETLYGHTGGNPLFTIELLRGLQERGDLVRDKAGRWVPGPALHWERLPARVDAVIAERIDRLPAECQELLQVASVEGEEFTTEVLARVANLDVPRVIRCLSETLSKQHRLVRAARLLRREPGGQTLSCYRFAHGLFQRYVYDHLDGVARAHLHRSVAEALEALRLEGEVGAEAGAQDPTAPGRLAWHWEAAGRFDKAAGSLLQAGNRAMQLTAYAEAVQLLRRGLALVQRLPESPERAQLERQLLVGLVGPLMPAQGWASAERAELARRALDLELQRPASDADLIAALCLQLEIVSAQGKQAESVSQIERLLHLARRSENPAYLALGHYLLGQSRFFSGDAANSISEFRQALTIYDRLQHASLLPWTDGDLGVRCLGLLTLALCYVGRPDQGLSCSQQALAQAQELAHPLTEAVALTFAGCAFYALLLETRPAQKFACRLIELSEQKRLPMFRPFGLIYQGWAEALGGGGGPAIAQIRDGLAAWRAMGHRSGNPFLLGLLAEALRHSGAWDEALSTVDEGLALAVEIGAPHRPDLYRLKGELLNSRPTPTRVGEPPVADEAVACFQTAITEARQHGLKLLELRATVSLARLWAGQGRQVEARQALADLYGWFSEGFDTPDLRAAKTLLNTLP
jgi:DNA-binding SARP family transcriptional activator/predicted ATPase